MIKILVFLLLVFVLSSCSIKNYQHTQEKIITLKMKKFKFADLGYIRNSGDALEMELFIAGNTLEKFSINHLVCINAGCISKGLFNERYLNKNYPDNILQNIILGKKIYNSKNLKDMKDGFEQYIKNEYVEIVYKVSNSLISFKDKKNSILFKIKDIK